MVALAMNSDTLVSRSTSRDSLIAMSWKFLEAVSQIMS